MTQKPVSFDGNGLAVIPAGGLDPSVLPSTVVLAGGSVPFTAAQGGVSAGGTSTNLTTLADVATAISTALTGLALSWQDPVISEVGTLPGSPTTGDRYILTTTKQINQWSGTAWVAETPAAGWVTWDTATSLFLVYTSVWSDLSTVISHNLASGLQGGTTSQYYHLTSAQNALLAGSLAQHMVLAAPNGSAGVASARLLDFSDITTGIVPTAQGGTGANGGSTSGYPLWTAGAVTWSATIPYTSLSSVPSSFVPSAHASTHANGGSDQIAIDGVQVTTGTVAPARGGTGLDGSALAGNLALMSPNGSSGAWVARAIVPNDISGATAAYQVLQRNAGNTANVWATLTGTYPTIYSNGTLVASQPNLNFVGGTVTNSPGTSSVIITLAAGITALTGDVTASGTGSVTATLASVISAAGPIGAANTVPIITYDAKGRLTAVSTATITPSAIGAAALTANSFTGKQTTAASATGGAGFNLPPGSAPSSPNNGDLWTTSAGLYVRIAGATVGPLGSGGGGGGASLGANTFTGKQTLPAGTTSAAPLSIPQGSAPTSPSNGDVWTTSSGLYVRIAGATVGPLGSGGGGGGASLGANTFTGTQTLPASITSAAPLNIPEGTAPTSPNNGDMWTTSAGLYVQIGGSTVGPLGSGGGGGATLGANTFTGLQTTAAPTTLGAGLNLPQGTAPTSPNNGDLWVTSSGLYVQIAGSTIGPLGIGGSGTAVTSVNTRIGAITLNGSDIPAFAASGGSHAPGAVPDPGAAPGILRFLREDANWATPPLVTGDSTALLALPASTYIYITADDSDVTAPTNLGSLGVTLGTGLTSVGGKFGQGFAFDGSTSVIIGTNPTPDLPTGSSWSVACWVNTTTTSASVLFNTGDVTLTNNAIVLGLGLTGTTAGHVSLNGALASGAYVHGSSPGAFASTGTVNDGAWHFVVGVKTPTHFYLYIDGSLNNSTTITDWDTTPLTPIWGAGYSATTYSDFYAGSLDEMQFYGVALTTGQITGLYTSGIAYFGAQPFEGSTPAPVVGDAAANMVLGANGQWGVVPNFTTYLPANPNLIPTMTSANTPSPFDIIDNAGTGGSTSQAWELFTGVNTDPRLAAGDGMGGFSNQMVVDMGISTTAVVNQFTTVGRGYLTNIAADGYWTVDGSNDFGTWTNLITSVRVPYPAWAGSNPTVSMPVLIPNAKVFRFYRFTLSVRPGAGATNAVYPISMQLNQLATGTAGLVPAPLSTDVSAGKVLGAVGGWVPLPPLNGDTPYNLSIVPTMTSATAPSPFNIIDGTGFSNGTWGLFSGTNVSYLLAVGTATFGATTSTMTVDLGSAAVVNQFTTVGCSYTTNIPTTCYWSVDGSQDNVSFTNLVTSLPITYPEWPVFPPDVPVVGNFTNATAYRYYRFTLALAGGAPSSYSAFPISMQLAASGPAPSAGLAPAPASGDAAADKFLHASGKWVAPSIPSVPSNLALALLSRVYG